MPKAILQVNLIEVADHILSLILWVIDLLNAIEDDYENDLMRHDACVIEEVFIAFLDAFDGGLQHVLWFWVYADADGQLDSPFGCPLEKRE